MNILTKVVSWIAVSSKNPNNWSLTLKGLIPLLVILGIGDVDTANNTVDAIVKVVEIAGTLVTAVMTAWGLARKLWNSFVPKSDY